MAIPDADIHPTATGAAHTLVQAHQSAAPHILYSGWFCPFVQRSWITLEEKKLAYKYTEINPYDKSPSFLRLNPRGLVPTLGCPVPNGTGGEKSSTDGDEDEVERKPLIESNIISEYLDALPSDLPSLLSEDNYTRARQKIWIDFVGARILPAYHRLLQHTPDKAYSLDEAKTELRKQIKTWIEAADPRGPFFDGEKFGMVDVTLAPWAVRFWVFEYFKNIDDLVPAGEAWGKRWEGWVQAVLERESVRATTSERGFYEPIYKRYADDEAQSEMAKAIRAGRVP